MILTETRKHHTRKNDQDKKVNDIVCIFNKLNLDYQNYVLRQMEDLLEVQRKLKSKK